MRALLMLIAILYTVTANAAVVSGKTVYRGMGVEGAFVTAHADGKTVSETLSTYHGDFRMNLPPGTYEIRAETLLPSKEGDYKVEGLLFVTVTGERVDRVVIELVRP